MKKYTSLLVVLGCLALGRVAQAADWSVTSFQATIAVQTDSSIQVQETISAMFNVPKHGIFRNIPIEYTTDKHQQVQVPLTMTAITRDGQPEPYTKSIIDQTANYKIGDPDVTLTGAHTYVITYTAEAAVNFFTDHDELYWNVTGDQWDVPLSNVKASISIPGSASPTDLQATCYTGQLGSTAHDCTSTIVDNGATYSAHDYLTIVFGWPKGIVTKPGNYESLRAHGTTTTNTATLVWLWLVNLGLPLVIGGWMAQHWWRHGRDPKDQRSIIAQYDPPDNLTPGEMGVVVDERANHQDIVATIVDLAVKGYVTITETSEAKFMGLGSAKDYRLNRTKKEVSGLRDHEKDLLESLFSSGDEVTLSSLKGTFADDVRTIQKDLYTQVAADGYFMTNPNTVRTTYIGIGLGVIVLGFIGLQAGVFGPMIAGVFILVYAPFMPKRSQKGVDARWHARGFKLFLEKAEKYRIKWQEKENIFEQYLPYAMAFGVADKWSKAFEGIERTPPNWYHGAYGSNFNTLILWSALNNFSTTSVRSFAPPAASGGSGFGGGGFSGGGFGGGGGGSW